MKKQSFSVYAVPALLILFFLLSATAAGSKSATYDESVHIFSGWRILTQGDFHTNHEHPPLMKILAAVPLSLMGLAPPEGQMRREVDEWSVSHEFVYHVNDADRVLAAARLPILLLATLLAWAVYRYTSSSMGEGAGVVALALVVTEPNILAHSSLVTTDLGITAMTFFTLTAFVQHLRTRSARWLAASGILFGLALLTKFTAVLLAPMLLLIGAVFVWLEESGRWKQLAGSLSIVALLGLFVLNLGYGFGGTFSTLNDFPPESETFRERAAGPLGRIPLPVPVEYVRGFDHAEAGGQEWWAYLFGDYSRTGWRHYYLAALAVKTPLPLLLLAIGGLALWPRVLGKGRERMKPVDILMPQIPLLVYLFAFTLSTNLKNIGLRYILPVYPFLCVLAAVTWRLPIKRRWLVTALVGWQCVVALWMYPNYLSFFNLTVGGPSRGREVLLDSNLDWGQDLKGLGEYVNRNGIDKIYVDYFGRGCLAYYGIRSTPDFEGGHIAVSATHLKGVYFDDKDRYRFLWNLEPEAVIGGSIFIYDTDRPAGWKPRGNRGGD